jgi:multiple sugar transport system permease protein
LADHRALDPGLLWLMPTLWMVSLSFQPNEVLARTTSTTASA